MDLVDLSRARRDARYYFLSNLIRALLIFPVSWELRHGPRALFDWSIGVGLVHTWVAAVEAIRLRWTIAMKPEPDHGPSKDPYIPPKPLPYYGPYKWESEKLYRALAMEQLRQIVVAYKRWARDDKREVLGPIVPEIDGGKKGAADFVKVTHQSEIFHILGFAIDLPSLIGLIIVPSFWLVRLSMSLVVLLDIGLIILQRYHRARMKRLFASTKTQ